MASKIIQDERIKQLNQKEPNRQGTYVLYWMQASQRAEFNHALEYAIQQANELRKPLLVAFGLMDDYPEANLRHYAFMLEGLRHTMPALERRGIKAVVQHGHPADVALRLGQDAALIVCDRGYLRHQRTWRSRVAEEANCRVIQVETDVVVPVETASDHREYAARTLRPKIHRHMERFLVDLDTTALDIDSSDLPVRGLDLSDLQGVLDALELVRSVPAVSHLYGGGTAQARSRLADFIDHKLDHYDEGSSHPEDETVSHMSMYLHFGQISPVYIALQVMDAPGVSQGEKDAYLEQLIVRRELAMNFVYYAPDYDSYSTLPDWAKKTLEEHKDDPREFIYTRSQFENAETHDPYWNAAMLEMKHTGYMHNYMRMYWGKKILEWTNTPGYAFQLALDLNNKYFLDGRDPNSYTGVAWVFGLHDRAWKERAVYGKIRYMSASGLERKADPEAYVERVQRMIQE